LMPGERSSTVYEPAKHLWGQLPALNAAPGVLDASLLVGYVLPTNKYRIPSYPFVPDLQWKPFTIVSARSPQKS